MFQSQAARRAPNGDEPDGTIRRFRSRSIRMIVCPGSFTEQRSDNRAPLRGPKEVTTPAAAGWYQDPQGRFGSRYFDGRNWTATVRTPDGWTGPDWQAPVPPQPPQYPGQYPGQQPQGWGQPAGGTPSLAPGLGLVVVLLGLVTLGLSLSVLDWADEGSFLDVRKVLRAAGSGLVDDVVLLYFAWLGWGVAIGIALQALVGTSGTRSRLALYLVAGRIGSFVAEDSPHRIKYIPAVFALLAGTLHGFVAFRLHDNEVGDFEVGTWIGFLGYALVVAGCLIGPRRVGVGMGAPVAPRQY